MGKKDLEIINGYQLLTPLSNTNAGFCKWAEAIKVGDRVANGKHYFIKQFLSPVYPSKTAEISESMRKQKEKECSIFCAEKTKLYAAVNNSNKGNIIGIIDFFDWESHYYIVTEYVDQESMDIATVSALPLDKKLLLMKVLSNAVSGLAANKVIHGDIKPDNILIKRTMAGFYTLKLIDFDSSYFEGQVAENRDEIQGDAVYMAPETCLCVIEEEDVLTTQADVFSLGIIFHQYLSGKLPTFSSEYDYVYEAVLEGGTVNLSLSIQNDYRTLIECMLRKEPHRRPTMAAVHNYLNGERPLVIGEKVGINPNNSKITSSTTSTAASSQLKGSLLKIIGNER